MQVLMRYDFPGNVRELENIIERGVVYCRSDSLILKDLCLDDNQFSYLEGLDKDLFQLSFKDAKEKMNRIFHNPIYGHCSWKTMGTSAMRRMRPAFKDSTSQADEGGGCSCRGIQAQTRGQTQPEGGMEESWSPLPLNTEVCFFMFQIQSFDVGKFVKSQN